MLSEQFSSINRILIHCHISIEPKFFLFQVHGDDALKLWFNENESPLHVQWGSIMEEEYTKKDGASARPESQFIQIKGALVPTFSNAC